jgi:hypothetical protein
MVSLKKYTVPLCNACVNNELSKYYSKVRRTYFHDDYDISSGVKEITQQVCDFCGSLYLTDFLFENFGFNKKVCSVCLRKKEINILLSNNNIKPIWRHRK